MSPVPRRESQTARSARVVMGGKTKKDRGRNAGPLAPSSPWLQSLTGGRVGKRGIMGPRDLHHPPASTTTVQPSRRLVPSTPARVPRPRRLAIVSGGPRSRKCRPRSFVPSLPLCATLQPLPLPVSQFNVNPGLLSHCDGTRGGKRDKAAARKVSRLGVGGHRWRCGPPPPTTTRPSTQRCWLGLGEGVGEAPSLQPRATTGHSPISATRFRPLISCLLPLSTPCVRGCRMLFLTFSSPFLSLWLHASHGGDQTCYVCVCVVMKY